MFHEFDTKGFYCFVVNVLPDSNHLKHVNKVTPDSDLVLSGHDRSFRDLIVSDEIFVYFSVIDN